MSTQIRGNKQIKNITIENEQLVNGTIELNKLKEGAELIKRDGSVPFTGNIDAGNNKLVNVAAGVNATDAVNKAQLDAVEDKVGGTLITREIVSGPKDGVNVTFTLAEEPTLATEQIFFNGALLNAGANADYTISGNVITFSVPPQSGDSILANYVVDAIQLNVDVQATINQMNGRLSLVEADMATAESDIDALEAADVAMDARMDTAEADISALEVRATNIETNVDAVEADIAAEESRAMAAESALDVRVSASEVEILGVKTRMTAAEGDIDDLEAADVAMDSRVSNLEDGLQAETTARTNAVSSLNTRVTALETADTDVDSRLDVLESDVADLETDLTAEAATRLANDNTLQSNINAEIANRTSAVSAVQSNLNTEISDRFAAGVAEENARIAADADLQDAIDAEVTRAETAEGLLSGRVDEIEAVNLPEIFSRLDVVEANADQATIDIGIETNRALAAESDLSDRIDALEADPVSQAYVDQKIADLVNSAPAVLDTLKELSDALNGDENFATTIAGQISSEASARAAADNALDARIDALETNPTTQTYVDAEVSAVDGRVDNLVADLAQEVLDRVADVDAEESRAMAAESALDARVDALESAPPPVSSLDSLSDVTVASPSNGQVLQYNGSEWVNGPAPSTFSGSYNDLTNKPSIPTPVREVPSGDINGVNTSFTLSQSPSIANVEQVFLNGLLQSAGASADYTISGDTIVFSTAPESGWKLVVYYFV